MAAACPGLPPCAGREGRGPPPSGSASRGLADPPRAEQLRGVSSSAAAGGWPAGWLHSGPVVGVGEVWMSTFGRRNVGGCSPYTRRPCQVDGFIIWAWQPRSVAFEAPNESHATATRPAGCGIWCDLEPESRPTGRPISCGHGPPRPPIDPKASGVRNDSALVGPGQGSLTLCSRSEKRAKPPCACASVMFCSREWPPPRPRPPSSAPNGTPNQSKTTHNKSCGVGRSFFGGVATMEAGGGAGQ